MTYAAFNPQLFHQLQKPVHPSGRFDPYQSLLAGECGIKLRHLLAIVSIFFSTSSPVSVTNMAIVCCRVCKSTPIILISASFVRAMQVGTGTVYSGRGEADFVMLSFAVIPEPTFRLSKILKPIVSGRPSDRHRQQLSLSSPIGDEVMEQEHFKDLRLCRSVAGFDVERDSWSSCVPI